MHSHHRPSDKLKATMWIEWLEARLGHLGIPRLIPMIALLNGLVYVLYLFQPDYIRVLTLEPAAILHGQVWRLVSYIFIPRILFQVASPTLQPLFLVAYLWFMIWIGEALEQAWGAFRLTLYYALGMFGVTLASFVLGVGSNGAAPFFINVSLFLAFATVFPNAQVYAFFFIPMKVKWLAIISLAPLLYAFVTGPLLIKVAILICLLNYFLFFGPAVFSKAKQRSEVHRRRVQFGARSVPHDEPLHRCAVCKRTERDGAELEFRVAGDGEEYCTEHLPRS